jgi:hypothetical protein
MTSPTPDRNETPDDVADADAGFEGLLSALGGMTRPPCPRDLAPSVLARIASEPVPWWLSRSSRRRWLPLGVAAAAAAALLVTAWPTPVSRHPTSRPIESVVVLPAPPPVPAAVPDQAPPVLAVVAPETPAPTAPATSDAFLTLPGVLGPFATLPTFEIVRNDDDPVLMDELEDVAREVAPAHALRGRLDRLGDGPAMLLVLDKCERESLSRVLSRRFPGQVRDASPIAASAFLDEARASSGQVTLRAEPTRPSSTLRPFDDSHLAIRDDPTETTTAGPKIAPAPIREGGDLDTVDPPRPCLVRVVQRAR